MDGVKILEVLALIEALQLAGIAAIIWTVRRARQKAEDQLADACHELRTDLAFLEQRQRRARNPDHPRPIQTRTKKQEA